jgi:hypothetical protein
MQFAHISKTKRDAAHCDEIISPRGPHLDWLCLPFTISRFVILGIINSAKRFSGWLFSHVGMKVFKGIFPPRAYCYAPPAIMMEVIIIWVKASGFHGAPRIIRAGMATTMFGISFFVGAAARLCVASCQGTLRNVYNFAAFAPAKNSPHRVSVGIFPVWGICGYCELAKHLANNRYSLSHNSLSLICAAFRDILLSPGHFHFSNAAGGCN